MDVVISGAFVFAAMEWQWLRWDGSKGARTGAVDAIVQPFWGGEYGYLKVGFVPPKNKEKQQSRQFSPTKFLR
jgi:hypothetical protein